MDGLVITLFHGCVHEKCSGHNANTKSRRDDSGGMAGAGSTAADRERERGGSKGDMKVKVIIRLARRTDGECRFLSRDSRDA